MAVFVRIWFYNTDLLIDVCIVTGIGGLYVMMGITDCQQMLPIFTGEEVSSSYHLRIILVSCSINICLFLTFADWRVAGVKMMLAFGVRFFQKTK